MGRRKAATVEVVAGRAGKRPNTRTGERTPPQRPLSVFLRRKGFVYLFLLPTLVLVALFNYKPAFTALYYSFFAWDGYNPGTFVGLQNFRRMIEDPLVLASVKNMGILLVAKIITALTLPLLAAELVFNLKSHRMQYFYRVIFTVPIVVPLVVLILVWRFVYDPEQGILNSLLRAVGLDSLASNWLGDPSTALLSIIIFNFPWVSGVQFLLFLAALGNIPSEVIDSSRLDGCRSLGRVWRIDIPIILTQVKTVVLLTALVTLQTFLEVWVLTQGGPVNATMVPGIAIYQNAFSYGVLGYASAIGTVLFAATLLLSLVINRSMRSDVPDTDF